MATHVGKDGVVKIGANTIAEVNGWELTSTAEPVEDSELSDEWKTFKSGTDVVKEWSASINCWWDETDTNGQVAMISGASVTLNLYPEGSTSGDTFQSGTAIINEIGIAVEKGGIVTRTFSAQGSGALVIATV